MAKEIARNVMPSLHNKTHFKAASDLFNNTPCKIIFLIKITIKILNIFIVCL